MANLTSSLTLKLTDLLSGPAGEAAAALNKFGISAQDLQKSAKLDVFRQTQQSFAQARTTFREAQQNVRALAQQISATDVPTKQMERSFAAAKREVISASHAFQQQSAAIIASKTGLQSLGVPLNKIVTEETRLKTATQAATVAMEQQAQRVQSIGARIRRGMGAAFANIAPFLGPPILAATHGAVKAGAAIDSAQMGLRVAGIPDTEIARVTKMALKQQALYPQLAINEILDNYKELRSVVPKAADAERLLPVLAQTAAALKGLEHSGKVEADSTQGLGFVLKAAQVLGAAQNPKRLEGYLDALVKARQVKGDLVNNEQIFGFMAGLKGSGALLSDRFLHTTAMSLAAELKGGRAGSGIDKFVTAITAPTGAEAKEFFELGLMSRSDFKPPQRRGGFGKSFGYSTNKLGDVKLDHHVLGWELAQTDPDKWVQKWLLPALKRKGITDLPSIDAAVAKIFPGNAGDIVTKLITQADSYKEEALKLRASLGLAATEAYKDDAPFQLKTLKQAFSNFGGVLTSPIMKDAAHRMNFIARTFAEWAAGLHDWNEEHPGLAKVFGQTAVAGGTLVGGALTTGLVYNLWRGFGLKSSAAALDGSAVALTRAAVALGGSSIPGTLTKGVAAAGVPGALTMAGLMRGVPIALSVAALEAMNQDSKTPGNPLRTSLRAEYGIDDDKEPAPWMPGGKWGKDFTLGSTARGMGKRLRSGFQLSAPSTDGNSFQLRSAPRADRSGPLSEMRFPLSGGIALGGQATAARAADRAVTASPGDFSQTSVPTEGYRIPSPQSRSAEIGAASISPPQIDSRELDAKAAGERLGLAFANGVSPEMDKAKLIVDNAVDYIMKRLMFNVSPNVTPQYDGGGSTSGGGHNAHGLFSDYGIRP